MNEVKKFFAQNKNRWDVLGLEAGIAVVVWLAGLVFDLAFASRDDGLFVGFGAFIALVFMSFGVMILEIFEVVMDFNLKVSMGCTRKKFFKDTIIVDVMDSFVLYALIYVLFIIEKALASFINGMAVDSDNILIMFLVTPMSFFVVLLTMAIKNVVAVCIMKFGKKSVVIFYVVFILLTQLPGLLQHKLTVETKEIISSNMVTALGQNFIVVAVAMVLIVGLLQICTWLGLRKQYVNL